MKNDLSTDIENKICEMYNAGIGSTTIVKTLYLRSCYNVYKVLRKRNISFKLKGSYKKYLFNESFFEIIDNEYKAYWLGFIAADGSVDEKRNSLQIGLAEKDKIHLEKFKRDLESSHPIFTRYRKYNDNLKSFTPKTGCYFSHITLISSKMTHDLVHLGMCSRKTFTMKPPRISSNIMIHYWRGLFDGDGYCYIGQRINIKEQIGKFLEIGISCNEYVADEFLMFLESCDIVGKKIKDKTIFSVRMTGKNAFKFLTLIYNKSNVLLERKYQKYIEYSDYIANREIKKTPPGIHLTKANTYKTYTVGNGSQHYIGTFKTLEEAIDKQLTFVVPVPAISQSRQQS